MSNRKPMPVEHSLRRLVQRLENSSIPYAVMGGMALHAHGHPQMAEAVHALLAVEGLVEFRHRFVPKNYDAVFGKPRRFIDQANGVKVTILVTGLSAGMGRPSPILFPDPVAVRERIGEVYYVDLLTLLQLKLATRRFQDLADVVRLIVSNRLDESVAGRLHPSLRRDYLGCVEETRREEVFIARNG